MAIKKHFVVQRAIDGQFWVGENCWSEDPTESRSFRTKREAMTGFVLDYDGPVVGFTVIEMKFTALKAVD